MVKKKRKTAVLGGLGPKNVMSIAVNQWYNVGPPKVNLCWFLTPWVMFVKVCSLRVSSLAGEFCPS